MYAERLENLHPIIKVGFLVGLIIFPALVYVSKVLEENRVELQTISRSEKLDNETWKTKVLEENRVDLKTKSLPQKQDNKTRTTKILEENRVHFEPISLAQKPDNKTWKTKVMKENRVDLKSTSFPQKQDNKTWKTKVMEENGVDLKTTSLPQKQDNETWKTIVYIDDWFQQIIDSNEMQVPGHKQPLRLFGPLDMAAARCPHTHCIFTNNASALDQADLVIYAWNKRPFENQIKGHPGQLWACTDIEPPFLRSSNFHPRCDWSLSYTSEADLPAAYYGHFLPKGYSVRPLQSNIIDVSTAAYRRHQEALRSNASLEDLIGKEQADLITNKTRLVAFMSGHCPTQSERLRLVKELQDHIHVDTFGTCGTMKCYKREPFANKCWPEILSKYTFYLSMENSLCPEYITEKAFLPLLYGLVPIVYGEVEYSRYFPPHSYIDARKLGVKALAGLLKHLKEHPLELARYHFWRANYEMHIGGSLCDICASLQTAGQRKERQSPQQVWSEALAKCSSPPKSFLDPW